jgi:hypothetical protein
VTSRSARLVQWEVTLGTEEGSCWLPDFIKLIIVGQASVGFEVAKGVT